MRFQLPVALAVALAAVLTAVALGLAPASGSTTAQTWTAPVALSTCGGATQPRVVFPFSAPNVRSGEGAIIWLGSSPGCSDLSSGAMTIDIAGLQRDDEPSPPRVLTAGAAARTNLTSPLLAAGTTSGQIVAIAGSSSEDVQGSPVAVLGDGYAASGFEALRPLGGPASLVATMNGFIGDVDVASVDQAPGGDYEIELRAQRHYAKSFAAPLYLAVGAGRITALALGMDFRADSLVVWAQAGEVYAQYVTNTGLIEARQMLGPSGYRPQIAAVLSDDDRAFVIWTDEPPPGATATTSVLLAHSATGPRFHGATTLASFTEPLNVRLTPGSVAAERLSSEGVALLWPSMAGGNYVVEGAGVTQTGLFPASVISEPGQDVRLGAVATGPQNEVVMLLEVAPRLAGGFDSSHQQILATRSNEVRSTSGLGLGPLVQLVAAGPNTSPAVAVDPDTDVAVAAWQTTISGIPTIDWSIGSGA